MQWERDGIVLTDDRTRVNARRVYTLLQETYWAERRPPSAVEKLIEHSVCFSLLDGKLQVGFGRAVTDYCVFSWLADIIVDPSYRGRGLGKWMVSCILEHPVLKDTQFVLQTRDAHSLYGRFGFSGSSKLMSTTVSGL